MELNEILSLSVKAKASDIHIKAGLPPIYRINGSLRPPPTGFPASVDSAPTSSPSAAASRWSSA